MLPMARQRKRRLHIYEDQSRALINVLTLSSDAFQKREKANEDYTIRQREKEKLLALKAKLAEQQAHLKQLSDHMYVFLVE